MATSTWMISLALFALLNPSVNADYGLCGHRWASDSFYPAPTDNVVSVDIRGQNERSDLMISTTTGLILATSTSDGLFNEIKSRPMLGPEFFETSSDQFYSADVNGDSRDDVICLSAADGTIAVRKWSLPSYSFTEKDMAPGFTCPIATHTLLIGDFDGNGADDFLCLDKSKATHGGAPIYLNQACESSSHHRHGRHVEYNRFHPRVFSHFNNFRRGDCKPEKPTTVALPTGATPCDAEAEYMTVGDSNGDGLDDLICLNAGGFPVTYISKTTATAASFTVIAPPSGSVCNFVTHTIIPMDLDGDGDDDLICRSKTTDPTKPMLTSYYTSAGYGSWTPASCTASAFCVDAFSTTLTPSYIVGDFNGDGKEDLMCRFLDVTMKTRIVYAENL